MKLNRTLVLCLSIVLAASMALGGTLAFLTDTESKVNEFTVGDVDIELKEDFPEQKLTPGVKLKKEVTIENTGSNDAYVWFTYALPMVANHATDASQNVLHTNTDGAYWDDYRTVEKYWKEGQTAAVELEKTWNVDYNPDTGVDEPIAYVNVPIVSAETGNIVEVQYAVYLNLYNGVLAKGEVTNPGMAQVYLDTKVDYIKDENGVGHYYLVENGVATLLEPDEDNPLGIDQMKVIVNAYAIQADGLVGDEIADPKEKVIEAYKKYLGQWGIESVKQNVIDAAKEAQQIVDTNP